MPAIDTLKMLQAADIWTAAKKYLKSIKPTEEWCEGSWRYFTFAACYSGARAVAIFSVHLGGQPEQGNCVFVDEARDRILGVIGPDPAVRLKQDWDVSAQARQKDARSCR
jgi:hypothetical protein